MTIQTEFTVFMPKQSEYLDSIRAMETEFGDSSQLIVLAEFPDGVDPYRSLLLMTKQIGSIAGVVSAIGPIPAQYEELDDSDLVSAIERLGTLTDAPILHRQADSLYANIRVLLSEEANARSVLDEIDRFAAEMGYPIYISGEPYLEAKIYDYILRIIVALPPAAIILMLGVFRLRIGSTKATIISMAPAIVGAAATLGALGWIQGSVSIVSVLVPIFIIVLGSADGLHVTRHMLDQLRAGKPTFPAIRDTLRAVGMPIVMTTLTTMAGFLSLLLVRSEAIQEMGLAAAGGILIAGIATWLIIPSLLFKFKSLGVGKPEHKDYARRALRSLRGWKSVAITAALIACFIVGVLTLESNFSLIDVYKPSTEVRRNMDHVAEVLGGSIPVYLTFSGDDIYDSEIAAAVLDFQESAAESGITNLSASLYRIIANASAQLTNREGYPPSSLIARRLATSFLRINPEFLDTFVSGEGMGRAVFFLRDLDGETLVDFTGLADHISVESGIRLSPTGNAFVMKEMDDQIIPQQLGSLLLAVLIVFLLTAVSQRSLLLGLISVAPIMVTLVVLFGVMGFARIDLSVITGIMSGLTVGVGID